MTELRAMLPSDAAEAAWQRIDAAARLLPRDDERTLDQQRADLLVDGILAGIPLGAVPEQQGRRPTVGVVVSLSTLLGLDDEPGDLAGYGAIPAAMAREIAADASAEWRRFVVDPVTGHLLDYGTTVYRPPQALRDFILARSPVCRFPGCNQPAYRCELDHRKAFPFGDTSAANLDPLCARHHEAKTRRVWSYRANSDGTRTWTCADGHSYVSHDPERWASPADQPPPPMFGRGAVSEPPPEVATQGDRDVQRARERQHRQDDAAREQRLAQRRESDSDTAHVEQRAHHENDVRNRIAGHHRRGRPDLAVACERDFERLERCWAYLDSLPPGVPPF